MKQPIRVLDASSIEEVSAGFYKSLASIGDSIHGKRGVALFTALKREGLVDGPYPGVSLFEAANRIMSDLVILKGISALLRDRLFPFTSYRVEFGHEDANGFDIRASSSTASLVGEAFNVAPSFFPLKKGAALKKLRRLGSEATYRLLMFNEDAVHQAYRPKSEAGLHYVLVGTKTDTVRVIGCGNSSA